MITLNGYNGFDSLTEFIEDIKSKITKDNLMPFLIEDNKILNYVFLGLSLTDNGTVKNTEEMEDLYNDLLMYNNFNDLNLSYYNIKLYYNIVSQRFTTDPKFGETYLIYSFPFKKLIKSFKEQFISNSKIEPNELYDCLIEERKYLKINSYLEKILGGRGLTIKDIFNGNVPYSHVDTVIFQDLFSYDRVDLLEIMEKNKSLELSRFIVESPELLKMLNSPDLFEDYFSDDYVYRKFSEYAISEFKKNNFNYHILDSLTDSDFKKAITLASNRFTMIYALDDEFIDRLKKLGYFIECNRKVTVTKLFPSDLGFYSSIDLTLDDFIKCDILDYTNVDAKEFNNDFIKSEFLEIIGFICELIEKNNKSKINISIKFTDYQLNIIEACLNEASIIFLASNSRNTVKINFLSEAIRIFNDCLNQKNIDGLTKIICNI